MSGRLPDPNRKGTSYLITFPDQEFINRLDMIAKREGIKRKALVLKMLKEGMERHEPGNPQTLLNSYAEGGTQNIHQLVGRVRQIFYERDKATRREVLDYLIESGVKGSERVSICKGVLKWLKDQGVEVIE